MVQGFQLTTTGLVAPEGMTSESWEQIGLLLFRLEGSIQWLIGDWLVYGSDLKYGDVKKLAETMGRDPGTFWEYANVCRSVKTWVRTQVLSYGHHRLVAPLTEDQQVFALNYAAENNLSIANFRKWLREQTGRAEHPRLPEGEHPSRKFVMSQFDKLFDRDPSKANPQEREQARVVIDKMQQEIDELRRKWED